MSDDPYVYPGTTILKNALGITDPDELDLMERRLVRVRLDEGVPGGEFDLAHLRAIHRHLFRDIYAWAGEIRTVEIAKGGHQFQFSPYIVTGMNDVHRRLEQSDFLRGLSRREFALASGPIIGDVNYVHPFRDGNGRTQLLYLEQLAEQAGHPIDLAHIDPQRWLAASRAAHFGRYESMSEEIDRVVVGRGRDGRR
ncbi:MAG: Fic family protein [Alphaproteobacteria bacterium]|nr:Fic family protein [Alphaproteobacteria bacterium]